MFDINSKSEYYMNTFQIKPFKSYDEALAHYNNVKPIRKTEVRPLGSRRHHRSASIVLDEATGDVQLIYISKPLVVWHKAGGITVNAPMHYSGFTVHTLHNYLPNHMFFRWDRTRLVIQISDESDKVWLRQGESLKFVHKGSKWQLESYATEYNYRKRPKAANKIVMSKYKPFLDWAELVMSIDNKQNEYLAETDFAHNKLREACGFNSFEWYRKLINSTNPPDWAWINGRVLEELPIPRKTRYGKSWSHKQSAEVLLNWISGSEPTEQWSWGLYVIIRNGCEYEYSYAQRKNWVNYRFTDLIKYMEDLVYVVYADEVLIEEQLPKGAIPSRSNRFYVTEPTILPEQTNTVMVCSE